MKKTFLCNYLKCCTDLVLHFDSTSNLLALIPHKNIWKSEIPILKIHLLAITTKNWISLSAFSEHFTKERITETLEKWGAIIRLCRIFLAILSASKSSVGLARCPYFFSRAPMRTHTSKLTNTQFHVHASTTTNTPAPSPSFAFRSLLFFRSFSPSKAIL